MIKYTTKHILYYVENIVFIESKTSIKKVTKDWFMEHCCEWSKSLCSYVPIESKIDKIMESNLTRG